MSHWAPSLRAAHPGGGSSAGSLDGLCTDPGGSEVPHRSLAPPRPRPARRAPARAHLVLSRCGRGSGRPGPPGSGRRARAAPPCLVRATPFLLRELLRPRDDSTAPEQTQIPVSSCLPRQNESVSYKLIHSLQSGFPTNKSFHRSAPGPKARAGREPSGRVGGSCPAARPARPSGPVHRRPCRTAGQQGQAGAPALLGGTEPLSSSLSVRGFGGPGCCREGEGSTEAPCVDGNGEPGGWSLNPDLLCGP